MIYQPPAGARDLLPLEVAQQRWLEQRLQQTFHRWSYQQIITPTLERLDTLMAGGAIQPQTVIQFWDAEEGLLGLRPELTASIARAAVTRMVGAIYPQRLYYIANIFRRSSQSRLSSQQEGFQAGVELLGGTGPLADAELLLLLRDCLAALELSDWHLILGEAGLTRSLLSVFPAELRETVRQAIASLDRVTLTELNLSPPLKQRALALMDLRGKPSQVLERLAQMELNSDQQASLSNLQALLGLVGDRLPLTLDLSLIQPFDYYTGVVFEVVGTTATEQRIIGQGGRYDELLQRYHAQGEVTAGIGFALNLEDLHQMLLTTGQLPQYTPGSHWLVVPENPQAIATAFSYADKLRSEASEREVRVEMALEWRSPQATRDYAHQRQISYIAWIDLDTPPKIEQVSSRG